MTLSQPGVYVIACKLHTVMGMVGVVVVGDPVKSIRSIRPDYRLKPKPRSRHSSIR